MTYEILLENFPDWAIPMCRVIPIFRTSSAYDIDSDDVNFTWQFNYWFKKVDDKNYILKIFINGNLFNDDLNKLPLYADLDLHIINERVFNPAQNAKRFE